MEKVQDIKTKSSRLNRVNERSGCKEKCWHDLKFQFKHWIKYWKKLKWQFEQEYRKFKLQINMKCTQKWTYHFEYKCWINGKCNFKYKHRVKSLHWKKLKWQGWIELLRKYKVVVETQVHIEIEVPVLRVSTEYSWSVSLSVSAQLNWSVERRRRVSRSSNTKEVKCWLRCENWLQILIEV